MIIYQRVMRNKILELIQHKERAIGRRLKQREIAEFVGVTEHTVMKWLRNEITRFDADVVTRLCDYFNCDLCDLLYFDLVEVEIEN